MIVRRFLLSIPSIGLVTSLAAAQPASPAPPADPSTPPPAAPPAPPGAYYAEPAPPAVAPQTIYVAQPTLPPLQPKSRYYHDGFYLRMSAGYAYLNVSTSVKGNGTTSTLSGSGGAFDILVGGTPAPGLVIGGGLLTEQVFDPGTTVHAVTCTSSTCASNGIASYGGGSLGFGMIGPFVDAFPMPAGGFHFGGLLGLAGVGLRDNHDDWSGGFGLALWTGYMWWVSSQWSLGVEARYTGAWSSRKIGDSDNQFDASDSSQGFALLFSAAYH